MIVYVGMMKQLKFREARNINTERFGGLIGYAV